MEIELKPLDRRIVAWLAERERGWRLDRLPEDLARDMAKEFRRKTGNDPGTEREMESDGALTYPEVPVDNGRASFPEDGPADGYLTKKDWMDACSYLDEAIEKRLSGGHLGLLEDRGAVDNHDTKRWYVADHFARFQLDVLEKAEKTVARKRTGSAGVIRRIRSERLSRTEGYGLETLATSALRYLFPGDEVDVRQGVWRRMPNVEIDVLVEETLSGTLWLGSCKRDPERQAPGNDWRHFLNLTKEVEGLKEDECPSGYKELPDRRFLFVSPVITEDARERLAEKAAEFLGSDIGRDMDRPLEWFTMDIADMLEGRGPRPLPLLEPGKDMGKPRREPLDSKAKEHDGHHPPETEFEPVSQAAERTESPDNAEEPETENDDGTNFGM